MFDIKNSYPTTINNVPYWQGIGTINQGKSTTNRTFSNTLGINFAAENNNVVNYDYSTPIFSPSGIGNYKNMVVKDSKGNTVQDIKYEKQGNTIIQKIRVIGVDGSILNKIVTSDGKNKTMVVEIKNRFGYPIVKESRSYQKINDDMAISTKNGTQYKIYGLSGNVITIEHNGQKKVIDLNKYIKQTTEKLDQSSTGKNLTKEQYEHLLSRIKNRSGDLILTFANEIDKLVYIEGDEVEGFYKGYADKNEYNQNNNIRLLKTCKNANNILELHELGHAVNELNDKSGRCWSDYDMSYLNTREREIQNFYTTNKSNPLTTYMQKFTNGIYSINNNTDNIKAKSIAANEEFAEAYAFFNNIDIETMDNSNYRTTTLFRHFPESFRIVVNNTNKK